MKSGTTDKLKFKKLKMRLGLTHWQAVGLLESIWLFTVRDCPRGDIGKFSNEDIAAAIEWSGCQDSLINAMIETGWLDASETHRLTVHDWHIHAPNFIKGGISTSVKKGGEGFCSATSPELHSSSYPAKATSPELVATNSIQFNSIQFNSIQAAVEPVFFDDHPEYKTLIACPVFAKVTPDRYAQIKHNFRDRDARAAVDDAVLSATSPDADIKSADKFLVSKFKFAPELDKMDIPYAYGGFLIRRNSDGSYNDADEAARRKAVC